MVQACKNSKNERFTDSTLKMCLPYPLEKAQHRCSPPDDKRKKFYLSGEKMFVLSWSALVIFVNKNKCKLVSLKQVHLSKNHYMKFDVYW